MTIVVESLKPVFEKHGVKRALIVDDAFQLTFTDLVEQDAWRDFLSATKQFPEVAKEIVNAGIVIDDGESRSLDLLEALNAKRTSFETALDAVSALLANFDSKLRPILELERTLKECDLDVDRQEPNFEIPDDYNCDIAFVDFFLDDGDHPTTAEDIDESFLDRNSVVQSRRIATEVFTKTKAFIILMSSYADVSGLEQKYQERSDFLLKGFFRFTPKESLSDSHGIGESLIRLPLDKSLRETVFDFTLAVEKSCEQLAKGLAETIRDLSIDDYAYLSHQLLRTESHPLGDYLLRLLGSSLVSELQRQSGVSNAACELDKVFLNDSFPLHEEPSSALSKLYSAHICEILPDDGDDGWSGQPLFSGMDEVPEASAELAELPFLRFGDLITRDADSKVFLVLNPGCDLMFGPARTERSGDDTIILLPGILKELHAPISKGRSPSAFTWLVNISGSKRRIEWDFRKFHTLPHKQVRQRCKSQNYKRLHRLRSPEALSLQQQFLTHIGRVGTHSPPPIASWHNCKVYCKGMGGKPVQIPGEISGGLVGMHHRHGPKKKGDTIAITEDGRKQLKILVQSWIDAERVQLGETELTDGKSRELNKRRKYLIKMEERVSLWFLKFDLDNPQDFPGGRGSGKNSNKVFVELNDVSVCREFVPTEFRWNKEFVVVLQLN